MPPSGRDPAILKVVPQGSLPRTDFEVCRVIDARAAFRNLYAETPKGSG